MIIQPVLWLFRHTFLKSSNINQVFIFWQSLQHRWSRREKGTDWEISGLTLPSRQPYSATKLVVQQRADSPITFLGESRQNFQGLHSPGWGWAKPKSAVLRYSSRPLSLSFQTLEEGMRRELLIVQGGSDVERTAYLWCIYVTLEQYRDEEATIRSLKRASTEYFESCIPLEHLIKYYALKLRYYWRNVRQCVLKGLYLTGHWYRRQAQLVGLAALLVDS